MTVNTELHHICPQIDDGIEFFWSEEGRCWAMGVDEVEFRPVIACPFCGASLNPPLEGRGKS